MRWGISKTHALKRCLTSSVVLNSRRTCFNIRLGSHEPFSVLLLDTCSRTAPGLTASDAPTEMNQVVHARLLAASLTFVIWNSVKPAFTFVLVFIVFAPFSLSGIIKVTANPVSR
jgi:hypothetical protein